MLTTPRDRSDEGQPNDETRRNDEGGFILVWIASSIVMLLVVAALAIEVGNWYAVRNKVQHQADTAALAGAILMPDLVQATSSAFDNLARNGVCSRSTFNTTTRICTGKGGAATAKVDPVPNEPTKVRVTVYETVTNTLGALIGVTKTTVSRTAVAVYQGPIAMGSPVNTIGDQPVPEVAGTSWSATGLQGKYWLNVAAWRATKVSGDRYQAGKCGGAELCASSTYNDGTATGANNGGGEWDATGYYFPIRIAANTPSRNLAVEVFDPAFVLVGDVCTKGGIPSNTQTDPAFARDLYSNPTYCTGDEAVGDNNAETLFAMHAPDSTPGYSDNPLVTAANCAPRGFGAFNGGNIPGALDTWTDPLSALTLRQEFRKWVRVCTLTVSNPNNFPQDFLLHVATSLKYDSTTQRLIPNPNYTSQGGHNRYSIRAGWVDGNSPASSFVDGTGVSIFAGGRLPIYANANGADTRFYLADLRSGADGRTLQVDFYDTGDASAAGAISLIPPAGATYIDGAGNVRPVTAFSGCALRFGAGAPTTNLANCTVPINGNGNGKVISLYVPIPNGYRCGVASGTDCWIRTKFAYPAGTRVNDTTTWSTNVNGDPTRLTE